MAGATASCGVHLVDRCKSQPIAKLGVIGVFIHLVVPTGGFVITACRAIALTRVAIATSRLIPSRAALVVAKLADLVAETDPPMSAK